MNHYPSLLLEKGTSHVSTIMKYQQDQMILRAHAPKSSDTQNVSDHFGTLCSYIMH